MGGNRPRRSQLGRPECRANWLSSLRRRRCRAYLRRTLACRSFLAGALDNGHKVTSVGAVSDLDRVEYSRTFGRRIVLGVSTRSAPFLLKQSFGQHRIASAGFRWLFGHIPQLGDFGDPSCLYAAFMGDATGLDRHVSALAVLSISTPQGPARRPSAIRHPITAQSGCRRCPATCRSSSSKGQNVVRSGKASGDLDATPTLAATWLRLRPRLGRACNAHPWCSPIPSFRSRNI